MTGRGTGHGPRSRSGIRLMNLALLLLIVCELLWRAVSELRSGANLAER